MACQRSVHSKDRRQQLPQDPRAQSFFDDDLEDALPQPPDVRVRHHFELLLPTVEGRRSDVQLPANPRLAPAGLVLANRPDSGVPRVALLAHVLVYRLGVGVGW